MNIVTLGTHKDHTTFNMLQHVFRQAADIIRAKHQDKDIHSIELVLNTFDTHLIITENSSNNRAESQRIYVAGISIYCGGEEVPGLEAYGLRQGGEQYYIRDFHTMNLTSYPLDDECHEMDYVCEKLTEFVLTETGKQDNLEKLIVLYRELDRTLKFTEMCEFGKVETWLRSLDAKQMKEFLNNEAEFASALLRQTHQASDRYSYR